MKRLLIRAAKWLLRRHSGIVPMRRGSLFGRGVGGHIANTTFGDR